MNKLRQYLSRFVYSLSYQSYQSTKKVKQITNDPSLDRPILLYEKISKKIGIRPYLICIFLIFNGIFVSWLSYRVNPELFWQTFTLMGIIIHWSIWIPFFLIYFYSLPYIKEKYFEMVEALRPPITTRDQYEYLKSNFIRKRLFNFALLIIFGSILAQLSYELILGYKVGFWTENMPAWSGFRFGPANEILGTFGVFLLYSTGADIVCECISWFLLPIELGKKIDESTKIYKDPSIFQKVDAFKNFLKNYFKMSLSIVSMVIISTLWLILRPVPIFPMVYVWHFLVVLLLIPMLSISQLHGRAVKKLTQILEDEYRESKRSGLDCSAAEFAHKAYENQRTLNNITKSQYYLKQAAESFEKCGAYSEAARHYSKLGKHEKAAKCYKKGSKEEKDIEYQKFYEACFCFECAEELIQEHNRDKSYEMLSTAEILFNDLANSTNNRYLKNTGIYYSREARGRLLIFDAIKIYLDESDKGKILDRRILDKIIKKLNEAQEIFAGTSSVCPNIKDDVKTQLLVNVAMCEFYKQFIYLEHGKHPYEMGTTIGVSSILGGIGIKIEKTNKFKYKIGDEFDNLEKIILIIENKFIGIHQLKAAEKARLTKYTIIAYKFYKKDKIKEATENVEYAENILESVYGKNLSSLDLKDKIIELTRMIFFTDFQLSAPMCAAVDPEIYKNCIGFELASDIPKKAQQNDEILFTFKIYSKPCNKKLPNLINLKLKISHIDYEKVKDLRLELNGTIHEQFLRPLVRPGINYVRVELLHEQKDCNRKIVFV